MLRLAANASAFAILYFLVAELTNQLVGDAGVAVLWPATGLYLGVLLLAPRESWLALSCGAAAGSLAAYLHGGTSLELSLAFALPNGATGLFGAVLVERLAGKRFRLRGVRDLVVLVAGGAVVANGLVALSAAAVAAKSFDVSFAESWLRWWSADALGIIAVAPIITAQGYRRPHAGDLRAVALVASAVALAVFVTLSSEPARTAVLAGGAIAFPALLWAGWRWGPRAAALGGLTVALAATHTAVDVYPVQGFLAVLLLGSLGFAAAIADRDRDLGRLTEELEERRLAADRTSHELEGSTEQLDQASRRVAELTAELSSRSAELYEERRRADGLARDMRLEQAAQTRTERELEALEGELGSARREMERMEREVALAVERRDGARRELEETTGQLGQLRVRLDETEGELSRARSESEALEERLRSESRALAETLRSERQALKERLDEVRAEQSRTGEQLAAAEAGRRDVEREAEQLSSRLGALEAELARARREKLESAQALDEAHKRHAERRDLLQRALDEARADARAAREEAEAARGEATRAEAARREAEAAREEAARVAATRAEAARAESARAEAAHGEAARAEAARRRLGGDEVELSARYDERGICLSVEPALARLLGYEPGELLGRQGADLLHSEDRPRLARARATGSESTFEGRLRRKTGEWIWVEVTIQPVRSWNGSRVVELKTTIRELPPAPRGDDEPVAAWRDAFARSG
jgi:PAS domain S-box-containing protein